MRPFFLALAVLTLAAAQAPAAEPKHNAVLLVADDLGLQLG